MKIKLKLPKQRNPLVAAAKFRKAGAHEGMRSARRSRRAAKHELYLQLRQQRRDESE